MVKNRPTIVCGRSERMKKSRVRQCSTSFALVDLPVATLYHLCTMITGFDVFAVLEVLSGRVLFAEHRLWQALQSGLRRIPLIIPLPCNNSVRYRITDSDIQLIGSSRVYRRYILQGFTLPTFERVCCTISTEAFRTYCRLISYNIYSSLATFPVLSFFDHLYMIVRRDLNSYEMKIFSKCREAENLIRPFDIVTSFQEFLNNMDTRFKYVWWRYAINMTDFVIAGGCVLQCLLRKGFDHMNQDIDLFYCSNSKIGFKNAVRKFIGCINTNIVLLKRTSNEQFYEIHARFENQLVRFQFIYLGKTTAASILYNFDIEIVQCAFNGQSVLCTLSFIESLSTSTFLNFNMTNNSNDTPFYVERSLKYVSRGFDWIVPKTFDPLLAQLPLCRERKSYDYSFDSFFFNIDAFNLQEQFLRYMPF